VNNLVSFGAAHLTLAIGCAAAVLQYAQRMHGSALAHVQNLTVELPGQFLVLDEVTRRNLELIETLRGEAAPTLLSRLDRCETTMGSRLMAEWLGQPLTDRTLAAQRVAAVTALCGEAGSAVAMALRRMPDIERIASRIALNSARPRELASLRDALPALLPLQARLFQVNDPLLTELALPFDVPSDIGTLLSRVAPEPAANVRDGGVMASGADAELDELRALSENAGQFLLDMETQERERTGIANLKVEYNKVHGFYIEITQSNLDRIPENYRRRQTLKNAERFITPELKAFEDKALSARERALAREKLLYDELLAALGSHVHALHRAAAGVAQVDLLTAWSRVSHEGNWCPPHFSDTPGLAIEAGRHPVVEQRVERFTPNHVRLGDALPESDAQIEQAKRRMLVITGPNMGGKSTYMRQTALIALLAWCGCHVPASSATIGPIDRIFTRIGAADDLAGGRSTFMVEMTEAAVILNAATERSLVLMDEIGRGTSTFDGLSLAWAIARALATGKRALTLFATHYFELTQLAHDIDGIANVHLSAVEHDHGIAFMHEVQEGPANQSYGIAVAKLAGIPASVVRAARAKLQALEASSIPASNQLDLFASAVAIPAVAPADAQDDAARALARALQDLDTDSLTPRQALDALYRFKEMLGVAPAGD
jgi:DNA mismatch repair protein MutS